MLNILYTDILNILCIVNNIPQRPYILNILYTAVLNIAIVNIMNTITLCSKCNDLHTLLVDLGPFVNRVGFACGHLNTPQFINFGLERLAPPFQSRNLLAETKKKEISEKSAPSDIHYRGKYEVCRVSLKRILFKRAPLERTICFCRLFLCVPALR